MTVSSTGSASKQPSPSTLSPLPPPANCLGSYRHCRSLLSPPPSPRPPVLHLLLFSRYPGCTEWKLTPETQFSWVSGVAWGLIHCQNLSESIVHFDRGQLPFCRAVRADIPSWPSPEVGAVAAVVATAASCRRQLWVLFFLWIPPRLEEEDDVISLVHVHEEGEDDCCCRERASEPLLFVQVSSLSPPLKIDDTCTGSGPSASPWSSPSSYSRPCRGNPVTCRQRPPRPSHNCNSRNLFFNFF